MWKSIVFLVFVVASFFVVEGLKCYQCVDDDSLTKNELEEEGFWGIRGHRSCKEGEAPDKDKGLEVTCDKKIGTIMSEPVCMHLHFENLSARNGTGDNFNISGRGCFYTNLQVEKFNMRMDFSNRTYQNLTEIALGKWKSAFRASIGYIGSETVGTFHYCKTDGCNPAPALRRNKGWILFAILVLVFTVTPT